jgi:hypothetical protein
MREGAIRAATLAKGIFSIISIFAFYYEFGFDASPVMPYRYSADQPAVPW